MKTCPHCDITLVKKFKKGYSYHVCPRCGRKYGQRFSCRLEDRPGMKKIFDKISSAISRIPAISE